MKKPVELDPNAAFPDHDHEPSEADLKSALGAGYAPIQKIEKTVRGLEPAAEAIWQYSERSGWYRLLVLKKRRLFYLIPKKGDFRLMLILGGKALELLERGPVAGEVRELRKTAKRYPEGTAFSFGCDADPKVVAALVMAKLAR